MIKIICILQFIKLNHIGAHVPVVMGHCIFLELERNQVILHCPRYHRLAGVIFLKLIISRLIGPFELTKVIKVRVFFLLDKRLRKIALIVHAIVIYHFLFIISLNQEIIPLLKLKKLHLSIDIIRWSSRLRVRRHVHIRSLMLMIFGRFSYIFYIL